MQTEPSTPRTRWTPGPWQLSYEFDHLLVVDEKQRCIADMGPGQPEPSATEQTSNAVMIQRAPQMADLLRRWAYGNITALELTTASRDLLAPLLEI